MEACRLNKYLSAVGLCSRREADRLIAEGRLLVNGKPAQTGQQVDGTEQILLDGKPLGGLLCGGEDAALPKQGAAGKPLQKPEPVLLLFHKPRGLVCTASHKDRAPNVIDYIGYGSHIYPIGRLDKESEGLLLLTNQGELVNQINRARYGHEKEYLVSCRYALSPSCLQHLAAGVEIQVPVRGKPGAFSTVRTRPCQVVQVDRSSFRIILTQGLNRQIRRMCAALGNEVVLLRRLRVMNLELGTLKPGEFRRATRAEWQELRCLLSGKEIESENDRTGEPRNRRKTGPKKTEAEKTELENR